MVMVKEQSIELYCPNREAMAACRQQLSSRNKQELEDLAAPFRRLMRDKDISAIDNGGNRRVPTEVTGYLKQKYNIRKDVILDFLCFMLADARNFHRYVDSLSEKDKKVWTTVLTQYYLNVEDITRLTGKSWTPQDNTWYFYYSYYRSSGVSDKLIWFSLAEAKGRKREGLHLGRRCIYCGLNDNLRAGLLPLFFPEACDLEKQLLDELPKETPLHTFSGEPDILTFLPTLNGLYETKQLALPKSKLAQSAVRKLALSVPLNEFFPNHESKEMALFRCSIVMNQYVLGRQLEVMANRPEEQLKQLFVKALYYPTILLPVLLPHLTGLRRNELLDSYGAQLGLALCDLLAVLPCDKWIPATGIHFKLMQVASHYVPLFSPHTFDKMEVYNDKLGHTVYLDSLYHEVSIPFINGLLYAMSAFGFVEVAYREGTVDDVAYTSSLAYVRLTNLGAYAMGHTKTYTPTVAGQEQGPLFELDGQHMIVRSLSDRNPYLPLLSEMAVCIGGQRYRVTADSFLSKCTNTKDIEERIAMFKRYICPEPSIELDGFFKTLTQHSRAITKAPATKYVLYHIAPEDKELQRIVSTDSVIRQYSLRAEGYLWLIEADKLKTIQKRLKECGYLF